jgi:MoxR-like ATPase
MADNGSDEVYSFFRADDPTQPLTEASNPVRPLEDAQAFPKPPPWRDFSALLRSSDPAVENRNKGKGMIVDAKVAEAVNATLILRRPLMVTGKPGTGKSSLAYAVAYQLDLGKVLVWPITSRTTLAQGLYSYDAVARLQDASLAALAGRGWRSFARWLGWGRPRPSDVGRYIRLGPLGTALLPAPLPRVLLIDEIDKSNVDLPNDLLHAFEEGRFQIPELARLPREPEYERIEVFPHDRDETVSVPRDRIQCDAFPFVVLTSNGERAFPPAFLRRCIRLHIQEPQIPELIRIVEARLRPPLSYEAAVTGLIKEFFRRRETPTADGKTDLATDQLLNAVQLLIKDCLPESEPRRLDLVLQPLNEVPPDAT